MVRVTLSMRFVMLNLFQHQLVRVFSQIYNRTQILRHRRWGHPPIGRRQCLALTKYILKIDKPHEILLMRFFRFKRHEQ